MIAADVLILPNYNTISGMGLANTRSRDHDALFFASAMGTFLMRQTIRPSPRLRRLLPSTAAACST